MESGGTKNPLYDKCRLLTEALKMHCPKCAVHVLERNAINNAFNRVRELNFEIENRFRECKCDVTRLNDLLEWYKVNTRLEADPNAPPTATGNTAPRAIACIIDERDKARMAVALLSTMVAGEINHSDKSKRIVKEAMGETKATEVDENG